MADSLREHQCPNCGAPLGIPHKHERFFKCQFCGTVLEDLASHEEQQTGVFKIQVTSEDIAAARQQSIPVYSAPVMTTTYTAADVGRTTSRVGCGIGVLILGILLVVLVPVLAGAGAFSGFLEAIGLGGLLGDTPIGEIVGGNELGGLRLYSYGVLAQLPSDDDTTPDIVAVGQASDDTNRLLYVDFESQPRMRWMSEVGEGSTYGYNLFASTNTLLFFSYKTTLAAYNRQNGALAWEITLSDEVSGNICQDCIQVFGNVIVTLSEDGNLAGFDASTGSQVWSQRLNEIPRQVINFGGRPAVLDRIDGDVDMLVFDPATGAQTGTVSPRCPDEPFPDDLQDPEIYNPVIVSGDHSAVYFTAGIFEPGCMQRWEAPDGQMAWQATFPVSWIRNIERDEYLVTDEYVILANDDGILTVSTANGTVNELLVNEDYSFFPVGYRDGVVVVLAERRRGTTRWEVWGVDVQLGNVKWTFIPQGADLVESDSDIVSTNPAWTAGLTASGLTIAVLTDEPATLVLQTIPLQSGTASAPVTTNLKSSPGSFLFNLLGWRGDEFWFTGDTDMYVVDTQTGLVKEIWP